MQVRVLSKGLKLTPTPKRNTIEMEKDIHNFTRKLRLTFHSSRNRNKILDIVVDYLSNQNFDNTATKNKSNVSKNEWEAVKSLKVNGSVVIKEAAECGAVVVMKNTHYYNIVVKILQDEETYKKPMTIVTKKFSKTLKNLLQNSAIVY